ncbi:MAG: hypothetical protein AABZ30_02500, partial [Myxococcota bacterium]
GCSQGMAVWLTADGEVVVPGLYGCLGRHDGETWEWTNWGRDHLRNIWGTADDELFVVGSGGLVLRRAPSGS